MEVIVQVLVVLLLSAALVYVGYLIGNQKASSQPTITDAGVWTLTDRMKTAATLAEEAVDKADVAVDVARETAKLIESFVPTLQHITSVVEEGVASVGRVEIAADDARDLAAGVADNLAASAPLIKPPRKRPALKAKPPK